MELLTRKIAETLKVLRKQRGWSLDKASQNTGVSKAMLGQIERRESSPTIATLWKIATGFETSFSSFIEDPITTPLSTTNDKVLQQIHPQDDKISVLTIFPYDALLKFEVFIIELAPDCEHLSPAHQNNLIEHVIVTEGSMEVLFDGQWKPLTQHQGLYFRANQPHGYRNTSNTKVIFHNIIHY